MIRIILNDVVFKEEYVSWQEIKNVLKRSKKFHGKIITATLDIRLIQSAYDFISNLNSEFDIAAVCTCVIQSHAGINGWKDEFNGIMDFTTLHKDNKGATKGLTISANSSSFSDKLLKRSDTEIPYDKLTTLDGGIITPFTNEYYEVDLLGIEVVSTGDGAFEIMQLQDPDLGFVDNFWPTINFETNNINLKNTLIRGNCFDDRFGSSEFSYYADGVNAEVTIDLELSYFYETPNVANPPTTFYIKKVQKRTDGTLSADGYDIYTGTITTLFLQTVNVVTGGVPVFNNIDINQTFTVEAGYGLYIQFSRVEGGCLGGFMEITSNTKTDLTIAEKAPATPCNFVPPFEWGQRIIQSITGQANGLDAPIFGRTDSPTVYPKDGEGALIFGTNGKLIRQFPPGHITTDSEKKAQLSASFEDWFENYDKVLCIGAGVKFEGGQYKLYVDDRKNFYKNEIVYEVQEMEAKSFEKDKLLDLYFNEVEVGSTYQEPEEIGANEEYNSKQKYSTPVLHENKLNLLTKWIYAAYPFEGARRKQFDGTKTTDYRYDKNNFMFCVYRDGDFVQLSEQGFDEVNGLEGLTTYINIPITPHRVLIERYGWFINTGLRGYQDKSLIYTVSDIVTDLSTKKTGDANVLVENSDILISTLDSPKFTGNRIRFSAPIPSTIFDMIAENFNEIIIKYYDPDTETDGYMNLDEVSSSVIDKATNWEGREVVGFSEEGSFRLLQDGSFRLLETGGKRLLEN